jgi:hypothetical protein
MDPPASAVDWHDLDGVAVRAASLGPSDRLIYRIARDQVDPADHFRGCGERTVCDMTPIAGSIIRADVWQRGVSEAHLFAAWSGEI